MAAVASSRLGRGDRRVVVRRGRGDAGAIWVLAETLGGELRPITLELLGRSCETCG